MTFLKDIFGKKPYPNEFQTEIKKHIEELIKIGENDDFLSERPGSPFNHHCRHIRAREIGSRLNEIGGFETMEYVYEKVRRKLGHSIASHLEYAWAGIGTWLT